MFLIIYDRLYIKCIKYVKNTNLLLFILFIQFRLINIWIIIIDNNISIIILILSLFIYNCNLDKNITWLIKLFKFIDISD